METEVARIERGEAAGLADLGLRLDEVKRLTAALQAEIVTAQVTTAGERRRWCAACGQLLASKGHYRFCQGSRPTPHWPALNGAGRLRGSGMGAGDGLCGLRLGRADGTVGAHRPGLSPVPLPD